MAIGEIALPTGFTSEHAAMLARYLSDETRLDRRQWGLVWDGVDMLRHATVTVGEETQTFARLYDERIDQVHADAFLEALYQFEDLVRQAERERAAIARQIVDDLRETGYYDPARPETQVLLVFCLYWWQSFSKGYAFEVEILRDLAASGVVHEAHDLRNRQARLTPFDLTLMGFRGDIKTSTYFFGVERGRGLPHDFYLTRLWDPQAHRWHRVAILRPEVWAAMDGGTRPAPLEQVLEILPDAAEIQVDTQRLVVVDYERWKEQVKARQQKRG
jgi:hypothetical protein